MDTDDDLINEMLGHVFAADLYYNKTWINM